jgi:hypothetical protein
MTHHMVVPLDTAWLETVRHAFLIRDPVEMVASYVQKRSEVTVDDLGLPKEVEIYRDICESTGQLPPVIDARDVLRQPEALLRRLCHELGVRFSEKMLSWPPGLRASDGAWAPHWYNSVAQSTGFAEYRPRRIALPQHLRAVVEACRPHYEFLLQKKLDV